MKVSDGHERFTLMAADFKSLAESESQRCEESAIFGYTILYNLLNIV